jgi:hypothetical protein
MTSPSENVSTLRLPKTSFRVNAEDTESDLSQYFLSPEFLRPYRGDGWVWPFPAARPAMAIGDLRGALLHAETYLDASLDAMIEGEDAAMLEALEVLAGFVAVALGQVRKPSATLQ